MDFWVLAMNVCIITFEYPPITGGVGAATQRIVRNLVKEDFNIHVIAPHSKLGQNEFEKTYEEGVTVHRTFQSLRNYSGDSLELQQIGDYVIQLHNSVNFDLIHGIYLVPSGFIGSLVASELSISFIASIRGSDIEKLRFGPSLLEPTRWVLERANIVTSVSDELLKKANQIADIRDGRVIPNAIDLTVFDPRELSEISKKDCNFNINVVRQVLKKKQQGNLILGTTGMIRYVKGIYTLLASFKKFRIHCPDAVLLIVGDFSDSREKEQILNCIVSYELSEHVIITGKIPHRYILAWMKCMDIFVFPSLNEGSPNALLEAMACGLPIIASQVGGISDIITSGQNGLLVPKGCEDALVENIHRCVIDKHFRALLGESAKKIIKHKFLPQKEVRTWKKVYQNSVM